MVSEVSQRIALEVGDCSPVCTQERLHEGRQSGAIPSLVSRPELESPSTPRISVSS